MKLVIITYLINKTFKLILHQTPTEYRNNLKLHHDI